MRVKSSKIVFNSQEEEMIKNKKVFGARIHERFKVHGIVYQLQNVLIKTIAVV